MAHPPTSWQDKKALNTWWQQSIAKEVQRHTNAPKPYRGDPTSTPTDLSQFAPPFPKRKPVKSRG